MPELHEYHVSVNWTGGRDGSGEVSTKTSGTTIPLAVPVEYGGPGGGANPEELLTSAIAGCYSMTFGIIAANRKIPVESLSVETVGEVEAQGPNLTFKKFTIRPTITLASSATDEQLKMAEDMAHKADSYCVITNAVRGKVEIVVEPKVVRA
jgi:peroxiredoxin-like protein